MFRVSTAMEGANINNSKKSSVSMTKRMKSIMNFLVWRSLCSGGSNQSLEVTPFADAPAAPQL